MKKIVFFCIPAYGHTNPTIEVVRELTKKGNEVWYYSFDIFKEKIIDAGAKFISCDSYLPELKEGDEKKIGKDFSALIEMVADTTLALDQKVCMELKEFKPDSIVSDSMCFWGKLFAKKLNIPYICSTTTFAFNKYTAKLMKQSFKEILNMILGMKKINKKLDILREHGYEIKNFISLIQNDNSTETIVYTSKEFQPMVETFSDKYSFIGPSVKKYSLEESKRSRKKVFISLGTVNNKNINFYKNCIKAFEKCEFDIVMAVGKDTNISDIGDVPSNFSIQNTVDQIKVLQTTDVFLTHAGMNSVNESLYYGVPMVLFPQHSEQGMVAKRTSDLGAGIILKKPEPIEIKNSIEAVMNNIEFKENAKKLQSSFKNCGGAEEGANKILEVIKQNPFN